MDGDFQDRPEVIHELLARALQGYEIVFVNRENRPEKTYYKVLQKIFYFTLNTLSGLHLDSRQANFSIISRNVVEGFNKYSENTRFYASTVKWLGFKRSEISASHGKRLNGKPSYTLRKRIRLAVDIILSFSERPLKLSVGLGVVTSLFAIISSLNLFWKAFTKGYTVLGWASVIISVMFFSGVILVVLGIIGLYLGKVFNEVKNRPLYLISERTKN
jgi:dolichol-phosphate mannosyltransferase